MTDTITLPREELQAALDALKYRWRIFPGEEGYSERNALCKTLEARLASERSEAIQQEENSFTPDWDAMAALTEEIQRMAKRIEELEREQEEKPSNADMEPVAWMHTTATGETYFRKKPHDKVFNPKPVYTTLPQREWQGLTEEEQGQVAWSCGSMSADWMEFARAIEAKLKTKNGF